MPTLAGQITKNMTDVSGESVHRHLMSGPAPEFSLYSHVGMFMCSFQHLYYFFLHELKDMRILLQPGWQTILIRRKLVDKCTLITDNKCNLSKVRCKITNSYITTLCNNDHQHMVIISKCIE